MGLLVLYFLVGYMVVFEEDFDELQAVKEPIIAVKPTIIKSDTNTFAHFFIIGVCIVILLIINCFNVYSEVECTHFSNYKITKFSSLIQIFFSFSTAKSILLRI